MDQGEENERRRKGGKKVFLLIHAPYYKVVHNADDYGEKGWREGKEPSSSHRESVRFSIRPRSIFLFVSIRPRSIFLFVHAPYFYSSTLHISIRPRSIFLFVHAPYFYSSTLHISIRLCSIFLFVHAPYFYLSMLHISIRPRSIFLFVHAPYFYSSTLHNSRSYNVLHVCQSTYIDTAVLRCVLPGFHLYGAHSSSGAFAYGKLQYSNHYQIRR